MAETIHQDDGSTIRRFRAGAVTYEFEVIGPEDDLEGYDYLDGEAPEQAVDALEEWIQEHHGGEDE
jgi:hypothetical protein